MKLIKLIPFLCIGLLFGCESTPDIENITPPFPSVTTVIDNTFPEIDNKTVIDVMEYLQVCTQSDTIPTLPPCSNKYFRIFELGPVIDKEKGFILEMRAGLFWFTRSSNSRDLQGF